MLFATSLVVAVFVNSSSVVLEIVFVSTIFTSVTFSILVFSWVVSSGSFSAVLVYLSYALLKAWLLCCISFSELFDM